MVEKGKVDTAIFLESTINTPTMICVEDYLSALGNGLIQKSMDNLNVIEKFVVDENDFIKFLAKDPTTVILVYVLLWISLVMK